MGDGLIHMLSKVKASIAQAAVHTVMAKHMQVILDNFYCPMPYCPGLATSTWQPAANCSPHKLTVKSCLQSYSFMGVELLKIGHRLQGLQRRTKRRRAAVR